MTLRSIYEAVLIELNKAESPNILLDDFNYYVNKAISLYINKWYNLYEMNQLISDNLRVLSTTAVISVSEVNNLTGKIYELNLPTDYLHILNCICNFRVNKNFNCFKQNQYVQYAASKQTSDNLAATLNNAYFKPSYKRPYYFIHNVNTLNTIPTNPIIFNNDNTVKTGTDYQEQLNVNKILFGNSTISIIDLEKQIGIRYGNISPIRVEIRCGNNPNFELVSVNIDYIKTPLYVRLTQELLDSILDLSLTMEFQDYVCREIINELVKLILENTSNPRLLTNLAINQTIANPVQQGQQKQ